MFPPKNVLNVMLARFKQNQDKCFVNNAPLVLVKAIPGKRRVYNAVPENSMMLQVQPHARRVSIRRTLVEKKETAVALIVQWVGRPKRAVPNVSRVVRVRLAKAVKIAQLDLLDQEKTTQPNANNATEVLQPQHQAPPAAAGAN